MKPFVKTGLVWTAGAVLVTSLITAGTWASLPTTGEIPVHWGPDGTPDRFGGHLEAGLTLLAMPVITLFVGLVLAFAPSFDPRKANIEKGRRAYLAVWISVMLLLVLVQGGVARMMTAGLEADSGSFVRWVIAGSALMIIVIGNYLPKTRSSFFFGVRTPWTLSSDIAWEKTHRFAGPLFMLAGALGLAGAFLFNGIWLAMQLTVLIMAAALVSVVYSYFAWKGAADRDDGTGLTV
jgi:uncharacterized membrane protein